MDTSQKNKKASQSGFSLIELMVSLTVFAIVMLVSTSTLLTMISANAKAQAMSSAMTNLSFALDSITREIRMGHHYYCEIGMSTLPTNVNSTRDCGGTSGNQTGNFIAFTRGRDSAQVAYRLVGTTLEQKIGGGSWTQLTADEVIVNSFELITQNTDTYDATKSTISPNLSQPTVDLILKGRVDDAQGIGITNFNIQTHIVQRRLDIL